MKTFLVYETAKSVQVIAAENARRAKSLYLARTFSGAARGSKRTVTVLRDTLRNRRKLGLAEALEQKPNEARTKQIGELRAHMECKRTK